MPFSPYFEQPGAVCSLCAGYLANRSGSDVGFGSTFSSGGQRATIEMRGCAESSVEGRLGWGFPPF